MKDYLNKLSNEVIGAAIEVHKELGPGLLESTYEASLQHELGLHGISSLRQVSLPINYKGLEIPDSYRIDQACCPPISQLIKTLRTSAFFAALR